jgi:cytoskeletal protein CcmA (bactofilin family)
VKKYKGLPKHLQAQTQDRDDVQLDLPEHEPLGDEASSLDVAQESDANLDTDLETSDLELAVEASEEDSSTDLDVETRTTGLKEDAEKPKVPFWKSFVGKEVKDDVSVVQKNLGVERKEEERVMSYGSNRPMGAMEPAAVISSTMVINGDIELDTSLAVSGKVIGNVTCKDQVDANEGSQFEGNINAASTKFTGGQVKGNVTCTNRLEMDQNSTITGDVVAQSAVISGTVVGQIRCSDSVTLTRTASVKGDLFSASISVEAGAKLEGKYVVSSTDTKPSYTASEPTED